ncbi:PucR family transcriptional regulator [Nocardioides perillae]|uniref:Sugar diacid utilization regulator n=1 Tax=Nocardioides perillae TaxID=1119534 RepID=A0A7Y9UNK6_9ACTN|nr:helix-turn-helix domain-containing protein [Nocardioides perillae]NYG56561.1 sugar diacid utilization regulator [Nocardioides perillae]
MTALPQERGAGRAGEDVLAAWVRDRADDIAARATVAIWEEIEAYADLADRTLRAEVEAHCRQVFTAFIATVQDRRDPSRADFPWTGRHAMRRVDLGITLTDFMKAFRIGQISLWDEVVEAVRVHPGTTDAALTVAGQLMRTIEAGSTAAAEAYLEAQQFTVADHARLARDLLDDLLEGRPPTVRPRLEALADVGIDAASRLVVAVGSYTVPGDASGDRKAHAMLRSALTNPGRGLVVVRHDEVVAVLPVEPGLDAAEAEERVLGRVRAQVASLASRGVYPSVGVSSVREGFLDVPEAYEEARLARRSLQGRSGVQALSRMSTLDYLVQTHDRSARRLVRPEVRAFVQEDLASGSTFTETLRAYVAADLNAKMAAVQLHVHPNTVYYRLERIAERTGCDVRRVEELIDLLLAVGLVRGSTD